MKGDFTRDTFDPAKHYSRVLLHQGRVALDADWNEQSAITFHFLRALARDLIGPHGGPGTEFSIATTKEGITGFADLDQQRRDQLTAAIGNGDFVINPGHYYVDAILIENDKPILYTDQLGVDPKSLEAIKGKPYLIYLDVWERHITYLEDSEIREVALGGPDTATRAQIIWQVKVLRPSDGRAAPPCKEVENFLPTGTGLLRARARQDPQQRELCVIPPEARYRGPENQLYRVEIHKPGKASGEQGATFKWSRENGAVVFPIRDISVDASGKQTSVTLATLGPDARFGLKEGDWVEILDERYVLENRAESLLRIAKIDREQMRLTIDDTTTVKNDGRNKILRRWDGTQAVQEGSGWIGLEDGVEISFQEGKEYRTGDYWLIPARVATGDVNWPRVTSGGVESPAALPPKGPRHHYAPLAQRAGGTAALSECRCTINKPVSCPTER